MSVYGNEYDYSKTKYVGCRENITATCHKHGDFERPAFVFLQGIGCRQCKSEKSQSGFRSDKPASLYIFELEGNSIGNVTGYGISSNTRKRLQQHLKNLDQHAIKIVKECYFDFDYGYQALNIETQLKRVLQPSAKLLEVVGFKKESSDLLFKDVVLLVEDLLKTKDDFIYGTRFEQSY